MISSHFFYLIELSNSFFARILSLIPYNPSYFYNFLPPLYSKELIEQYFEDKIFFSLPDLAPAFTYCILFSIIRYLIQNFLIQPFVELIFLKQKSATINKNGTLSYSPVNFTFIDQIERDLKLSYKSVECELFSEQTNNKKKNNNKLITKKDIKNYSIQSGRSLLDIKTYLYNRRKHFILRKKIVKFVEALWRFLFYSFFSYLGYNSLFQDTTSSTSSTVSWLIDTNENWKNWPFHTISTSIIFYYHIELGCYLHQLLWTEVSRSDALEMILHHIITISLIVVSFLSKFIRIGSIILFIHDLSDIFLELGKVLFYIINNKKLHQYKIIVDLLFGVFAIVFFYTRLYIYPFVLLRSVFIEGYDNFKCEWYGCYFFASFLTLLQLLHIFWFALIMRMVIRLAKGTMNKDERSDDDEDLSDNESIHNDEDNNDEDNDDKKIK